MSNMKRSDSKEISDHKLFSQVSTLIDESRSFVAQNVNIALCALYWKVGRIINDDILQNKRADYGKQIVASLARQLEMQYGRGWSDKHLRHCLRYAETFPDEEIVSALWRHLSWSHLKTIIYIKDDMKRMFYAEMCKAEGWSTRQLSERIDSMLYERTAISKKPKKLIKQELEKLRKNEKVSPDLIFRDPYVLNFLGLKDTYSEKDLENAILRELERFILELGQGFAFLERQKRMIIDGEDFKLDLLFYHRKLKRLVAIDLKLGKFKAAYKSQMELYLRWLEKNEMQEGEDSPLGLLLCAEGSHEQIELLQLENSGIKVAHYLTELPAKKLLQQKLHQAVELSRKMFENK